MITSMPGESAKITDPIEIAARELYARDAERSIGLDSADYVWPRVRDEYRKQAQLVIDAFSEAMP